MKRSFLAGLTAFALLATAAAAQTGMYYAERGHWIVSTSSGGACRAGNRPPEEFNYAPYNALQFVVRPGSLIGVEVFFWPGALNPEQSYKLSVSFDNAAPLSLDARTTMDFVLAVEPQNSRELWRGLQDAEVLRVAVTGADGLDLLFSLDDSTWLLRALQNCARVLPQP